MEPLKGKTAGTPSPTTVSTKLQRIAELAREDWRRVLTTLAHHIDVEFLKEAYRRTRKDGATGIDGQTAEEYEQNLEENLQSLLDRFQSGTYKAPPVRRVHIPKPGRPGQTRPIGIPTFEDKVLQRAVHMVLEAIYEQNFLGCSYGFRPRRSAHQALDALWKGLMDMGGGVILEVDIKSYFDTISHQHLRAFLDRRVRDGVLRRTVNKWLKAGVMEDGVVQHSEVGSPQGGVVSPLLSNVYLHYVMDMWFEIVVKPRLESPAFMIRFADDVVLAFASPSDARRVMNVLPKRFAKFGLELHPDKTRLVEFGKPGGQLGGRKTGCAESVSFSFLGFTHYWGQSRRGRPVVKRKTESGRLSRALGAINDWCRKHRHEAVEWQHQQLCRKLQGHYAYYGIIGNSRALGNFRHNVARAWRKWLNRRSHRARMHWDRFNQLLLRHPLPLPRVVHAR